MKYQAIWTENDKWGNKLVRAKDLLGAGEEKDYIISPTDKKTGLPFPGFADIIPGADFLGNAWTSPTNGKNYIFAPSPEKNPNGTYKPKPAAMKEMMETKQAGIRESQDNKQEAIKIASTMNKAVEIAIVEFNLNQERGTGDGILLTDLIKKWRQWLWTNWEVDSKDMPPFN